MEEKVKKKTTFWLPPDIIDRMDGWLEADNCQSRSEFVDKALRPAALMASTARPTQASTVSIALIAADSTPVWPTISGFAKLMMMTSYLPDSIASTSLSHTIGALISGFRS